MTEIVRHQHQGAIQSIDNALDAPMIMTVKAENVTGIQEHAMNA